MSIRFIAPLLLASLTLGGCSGEWTLRQANADIAEGRTVTGLNKLRQLTQAYPDNTGYRMRYAGALERETGKLIARADIQRAEEDFDLAAASYSQALAADADNPRAKRGLELVERDRWHAKLYQEAETAQQAGDTGRALSTLRLILAENAQHGKALTLKRRLEAAQRHADLAAQQLSPALKRPVTLEFRAAPLQTVFEMLSRSANLSFMFDRDVRLDTRATLFARNTPVEDALNVLLSTNQLDKKILNESTFLIYPKQQAKQKEYEDLVIKSFYLRNADPKQVMNLLKSIAKVRDIYVDDKLGLLTVRDTPETIAVAERVIQAQDLADPEVMLDVEVLEVSEDWMYELGLQFPDKIGVSVLNGAGVAGALSYDDVRHFTRNQLSFTISDPAVALNLKNTTGGGNTLAKPRIRVKSREKAKIHIGDRVPVVTTTTNQQTGSVAESINYLDVGVMVEVEPQVYVDNEIGMKIQLEVSDIVKQITTKTGLLTYQIGSRKANTVLRLKDGETQVLAGLIKRADRESASHLPGIGNLPLVGRLFSSENHENSKSELVLLITPHIVRGMELPTVNDTEFFSGTDSSVTTTPLTLRPSAQVNTAGGLDTAATAAVPTGPDTPPGSAQANPQGATASPSASPTEARLLLQTPPKVAAGHDFTVTLNLDGSGTLGSVFSELIFNPEFVEYVTAAPVEGVKGINGLEFTPQGQAGRVSVRLAAPTGLPAKGPLATLTFRAKAKGSMPLWLGVGQVKAQNTSGQVIPLNAPAPSKLEFE